MRTQTRAFSRLLTAAVLTIGATLPIGAGAAGAGVATQTNMLDVPFYLLTGSLSLSSGATVQQESGSAVAGRTSALDIPFYLLPDTTPATPGPRARAEGREVVNATNMLEIPPYLRQSM
ncbi:MAG: hypothetical protein WBP72_13935 [Rhodocyclaceae bacterium]